MNPSSAVTDGPEGANQSTSKMSNQIPTPSASTEAGTTTTTHATPSSQTSKQSSASNSVTHSPMASRDPSPTRHLRRATSSGRLTGNRSRQNSQQDSSPARQSRIPIPGPNNALRSLSATSTPILLPSTQDSQIQAPTPQKPILSPELKDPRWPVSPLSPETPLINVQRPSPSPQPSDYPQTSESEADDIQMPSGLRTPTRGPLETVQEVSQPNSPAHLNNISLLEQVKEKLPYTDHYSDGGLNEGARTLRARPNWPAQEGCSDSGGFKLESRRTTSVPPPLMTRQSSSMSTKQVKSRPEGSTQTMTVETETVSSIPQVALTTGSKADGTGGTLKTKPSTETIKPKKEKKRTARKQPSVSNGNASSKADIFEAKIASAVDEANTSDSEETFVYDSNPPDNGDRATRRFHSRTPSATSMASQVDRQNLRSIYTVMSDVGHNVSHVPVQKKSMKFANTYNSNGNDSLMTADEDGRGTGRSIGGSTRGTVRQHHHIGRWGRQPGNGHASLFDNESPFPNARSKLTGHQSRNSSGPPSPRPHHAGRNYLSSKRSVMHISSSYDLDETTGADDERTPLIERPGRNGRSRRPHNLRQAESQTYTRRSSYLNRFAACLVLTMMFLLVITGAIGFMFATSQPMTGIEIVSIKNVVTSEQVLIFDVTVKAHNPNIVVVTIDNANLEIFAKSEYAGVDSDWWRVDGLNKTVRPLDDPTNDPPTGGDGEDSRPNVLLGRITEFDSPLTFEGSLFHQGTSSSTGQMQLAFPGNNTAGGAERWERIYQNEFDLIVKGVVKYSLPLSAHIRSATVAGRTTVKPNSANDPSLKPNTTASFTRK
ncbi:Vacuolar segregation 7-like protein [Cladobotryum mycophilum]|uniref:Vacuolar segregation 7-like protein n=1 Tax=Cladobotryum mycophilum TaxID=491253 RepID=A0ABR0SKT0_9HYPO